MNTQGGGLEWVRGGGSRTVDWFFNECEWNLCGWRFLCWNARSARIYITLHGAEVRRYAGCGRTRGIYGHVAMMAARLAS